MKRARLIYNPTSGREAIKKSLPGVLAKLEEAGYETSAHATTGAGDATKAANNCD
ncbi:diacylglycerol kinase family enzyme [Peribacillus simplex]|nr:diacylglycerol kinase family enzyme [Peribacillus simplex]